MKQVKIYQVDAFTNERFQGNPAGVVWDATHLDTVQMQTIARELNCSETAFIFPSNHADQPLQIRYFTPTVEVPVCGHATIAAMHVWAEELGIADLTPLEITTGAGELSIEIQPVSSGYQIMLSQQACRYGKTISKQNQQILLSALGLNEKDLHPHCPIQVMTIKNSLVLLGIHSRDRLNGLNPNMDQLTLLSHQLGCTGYFIFTFDTPESDILTYGRMFAPAIGIEEDPVTGNAHVMLGTYLVEHRFISPTETPSSFVSKQGEVLNRVGQVMVTVYCKEQIPDRIQIGGQAVVIFTANLTI